MSKGCLIYAHNNGKYDYVRMAATAAKLVKKFLNIPVTLITDSSCNLDTFDSVIIQPLPETSQKRNFDGEVNFWHNQGRSTAYQLSPYDQTLLIDADYFIFNNQLKKLFSSHLDFACYDSVCELDGSETLERRIGNDILMQWATVIYFTKSELAARIFSFIEYIRKQYDNYTLMYCFRHTFFRNDYALSIALQVCTGYGPNYFARIPGQLFTLTPNIHINYIKPDGTIAFSYVDPRTNSAKISMIKNENLHILDKTHLFKDNIIDQIEKYAIS